MQCPKCKSEKVVKNSKIPLKKNGKYQPVQRYKCKECGYQFTKEENTKRYSSEIKYLALTLLRNGMYYREIATVLDIKSHSLIYYWEMSKKETIRTMKYNKRKLKSEVKNLRNVCETVIREGEKNNPDYYCYTCCLNKLNKIYPQTKSRLNGR